MWGNYSQRCQQNKSQTNEQPKNNFNYPSTISNQNNNEINLLFQTPIKQMENIPNIVNSNPFHFDFNIYFGNLWSSGHMPKNQPFYPSLNISPTQINKDNFVFCKKYIEKSSYKLTPISQIKNSNDSKNSLNNSNSNNILNQNQNLVSNFEKVNYMDDNELNSSINNDPTKKNLTELFNEVKNEPFLCNTKNKIENQPNNNSNNIQNQKNINKKLYFINNKKNEHMSNTEKTKYNKIQISCKFLLNSPNSIKKPRKIFECSGSTNGTNSSNKTFIKKKRFRKSYDQLELLKKFYLEHKYWSKSEIKEISAQIGLNENKVYKWLWDQRNKEFKNTKFIINKTSKQSGQ